MAGAGPIAGGSLQGPQTGLERPGRVGGEGRGPGSSLPAPQFATAQRSLERASPSCSS